MTGRCAVASIRSEDSCILETCSKEGMNWLSANNFCKAIGMGLWTIDATNLDGGKNMADLPVNLEALIHDNPGRWLTSGRTDDEGYIPVRIDFDILDRINKYGNSGVAVCD